MKVLIGYDGSTFADAAIEDLQNAGLPQFGQARIISVADLGLPFAEATGNIEGNLQAPWTIVKIISAVQTFAANTAAFALAASTYASEAAYSVVREADELERARLRGVAENSAAILRQAGLKVTAALVDGDPRETILSAAEGGQADTIFVGVRGLGRMNRLLGSVSSHIVMNAGCTVEVVRQTF